MDQVDKEERNDVAVREVLAIPSFYEIAEVSVVLKTKGAQHDQKRNPQQPVIFAR
jgi:hypothetical protein